MIFSELYSVYYNTVAKILSAMVDGDIDSKQAQKIVEEFRKDFETKDIPFRSDVVTAIDLVVSKYDPDVIFTHHPFDTHQAHEGVAKATIAAARRKNTVFFFEPIQPSGRSYVAFKPDMYVGIDETVDIKIAALKKHKSEYKKFGGEDWIKGVKSRCGFRGYEIGKKYAEAFEILRLELSFDKKASL